MTQHARDMANALRLFTSAQIQIVSERSFEGRVEQPDALEQFNAIDHEVAQIVERTQQFGGIRAAQDRMRMISLHIHRIGIAVDELAGRERIDRAHTFEKCIGCEQIMREERTDIAAFRCVECGVDLLGARKRGIHIHEIHAIILKYFKK